MRFFRSSKAALVAEPYAIVQALPACRGCGSVHPMARKPKLDVDDCPDCGTPVETGEAFEVPAAFGGFWGWIALLFLSIGRGLVWLAKVIMPKRNTL